MWCNGVAVFVCTLLLLLLLFLCVFVLLLLLWLWLPSLLLLLLFVWQRKAEEQPKARTADKARQLGLLQARAGPRRLPLENFWTAFWRQGQRSRYNEGLAAADIGPGHSAVPAVP